MNQSSSFDNIPFPVLIADVGGTNSRFALLEDKIAKTSNFMSVQTSDFPNLESAINATILDKGLQPPKSAVIAIAGPVLGDRISLTNADWVVEPKSLLRELGLKTVTVLNDFEALALSLPTLDSEDLIKVGGGEIERMAPKCILGPGTGLGVASLVNVNDTWAPLPSEGGHVELGPVTDEDFLIWKHLPKSEGRIGAESALSGPGILKLSMAVSAGYGTSNQFKLPEDVTQAAIQGNEIAVRTMKTFARALGRVAGDLALTLLARGGVYIAGSIQANIREFLTSGEMRESFENKSPHKNILKEIPIFLIKNEEPALLGLAALSRNPEKYVVNFEGRKWVSNGN